MRVMGASALCASPLLEELRDASFAGRPAFVWCDGDDVTGLFGDAGDTAADLIRLIPRVAPELVGAA